MVNDFNAMIKGIKDALPPLSRRIPFLFIGFCGKIYVGIRPTLYEKTGKIQRQALFRATPEPGLINKALWDTRDVHEEDLDSEFEEYHYYRKKGEKTIREWMDDKGTGPVAERIDFFQRHGLVSFAIHDDTLITNPNLHDFRFQRVLGGVQAFQMIEMFISGVLGVSPNPMIELTDKDRIQAHGFDEKSFRKEPTKRT